LNTLATALAFTLIVILPLARAQDPRSIGYPSVTAALEALRSRTDVTVSNQGGWTIVDERAGNAFWSFTPKDHPAHPAVVKRTLVTRDNNLSVEMTSLCEARKSACDQLMVEFRQLNERMSQAVRNQVQPAADAQFETQRIADDRFRVVMKSYRSRSIDAAQDELLPKAKELCGALQPGFGAYEFEQLVPVNASAAEPRTLTLKQEIWCSAVPPARPPIVALSNKDTQWRPTADQLRSVENQTRAYFTAKDGRQYEHAYSMLAANLRLVQALGQWRATVEDLNARLGAFEAREVRRITWYKDPPQANPGIYAAVDFSSRFANSVLHCGYLVWHEPVDGSPSLVREEQNFIDKTTAQKMTPADIEKVRAQFGCK
jgi:hypothetical protein